MVVGQPSNDGRIVGIGASAGGLESLQQLFSALPPDTGMAFVVVQHLSPDFRSLMDELIARHSDMPVVIAADGMPVEPNKIYLMPPRKEMIIRDRHLVLTDKEPHTFTLPIDTFFRSLAQDVGPQAVAIVLSGSGSDGSRGIVEIKRAGGLVLAETAASAKFDGMPLSAAATGAVDHAHPPRDLARILCGLPPLEAPAEPAMLSDDPAMDAVLRLLRDHFGIDFSLYKTTTVGRRIQRRIDLLHVRGLRDYVDQLRTDPEELNALYQDLLIGVTQFFRDPDAFDLLEREVIPKLLDRVPPDDEIRLWIAGCGTGEEAYSLAMLFWEALSARERPVHLKILATDVHQASLEHASAGVYGNEQLQFVTPERLQRFFTRRSSGYQISQDLRQLIVFARHNVTKDAPFTKMHFISCRNLLIYFQPHAQSTVLSLFHFGLAQGGILFLGPSETPGALTDEFLAIDDHWKIFRKRRDVQLLSRVRLPVHRNAAHRPISIEVPRGQTPDPLILQTYDQLLDRYMPPGFLVDENRMLVDSFGGAEKLLRIKRRRPTSNILELLDDELRRVVAGAIQRALKDKAAVAYSGVRVPAPEGNETRVTLTAEPLLHPNTGVRHVLVTFADPTASVPRRPAPDPAPPEIPVAEASRERMDTLETELAYTRETLQATIEELETSNEEMQATNEELVASNEELQSTNEELHSVNEELYTVNAEYQHKISELREVNSDMAHLLEGTDVGTVFLDRDLRIRRYTSRIASVFRFQPHDIGRRISDFSHNIERNDLIEEIERVRATGEVIEYEVRDRNATPYFLRILPYRITTNGSTREEPSPIDGVVLTLTDISVLIEARRDLEERQEKIATLLAQAEESARRREQFIAMLSHELRNPLAAVMNATTLLKKSPGPETLLRCQAVIERQTSHMKRLLDDLLDVSRITRGKFELRTAEIDLRIAIEAAIESTAPLFIERGVRLEHSIPQRAFPVRGDGNRLCQVVVNLLSNAANYSPRASTVRLDVTSDGDLATIRVLDHGVGIEPELQGKIFDLFVQSEQRLDRSRGGLGVGLSLARSIVELHGGTIEVRSDGPGRGSEFIVTLPLGHRVDEWAPEPTPAQRGDRRRIVLVDDQDDSREMLRMLLESRDHIVIDAVDGPSALEVIEREKPDVAFIDIGLPAMNGYEVAQRIRAREDLRKVVLVALTGYGAPSDISAARAAGFDEHVIKPAELAKLERILERAVRPLRPDEPA